MDAPPQPANGSPSGRLRRSWHSLVRFGPRLRDLGMIAIAVIDTVGSAATQHGWPGRWGVAAVGGIAALALWWRRRYPLASLRGRAERAEAERELRAEQARLAERARIAQEMHDVLAHKVSLIALHAGGLEVNAGMGPEKVEESAGLIRETARQAMEDLRQVLG